MVTHPDPAQSNLAKKIVFITFNHCSVSNVPLVEHLHSSFSLTKNVQPKEHYSLNND